MSFDWATFVIMVLYTIALLLAEVHIRKRDRRIAELKSELAAAYLAQGYAAMSLRALAIWRDNQLAGRYDRIAGEIEALKTAAKHHEGALREQRKHLIGLRRDAAQQFAAAIRVALHNSNTVEEAITTALQSFPEEGN